MENAMISLHTEKGRAVVAKRDFQKGETIFEETPLVSCQFAHNQDYGYLACDHCMKPLETVVENLKRLTRIEDIVLPPHVPDDFIKPLEHVQCPKCKVTYCSAECQQTAYDIYHQAICTVPKTPESGVIENLRKSWQEVHFPPEECSIIILLRIFAIIHQAEDKNEIVDRINDFTTKGTDDAQSRFTFVTDLSHIHRNLVECAEMLRMEIPEGFLTAESFKNAITLLALNSQGIATSSFAFWIRTHDNDPKYEKDDAVFDDFVDRTYRQLENTVGYQFLNNEGSGLYWFQSKMNHSCEPNTEIIFPKSNHVLGVKALRNIFAGEELTFSYVDECELKRSRHSRQKLIAKRFFFRCLCHRCEFETGGPEETSSDSEDDESDNGV